MKSTTELGGDWIQEALERHQAALTRYALRITGDLERARDVVQDTFLQLCRQKPSRVRDHLVQWLYTVCRNRALDLYRKESRMTTFQQADGSMAVDGRPAPDDQFEIREKLAAVVGAMEKLTPNQQEVIRLKFQDGLSYREISQITGLSVSNVGFQIHTGIKKLRQSMAGRDGKQRPSIRRVK